MKKARLEGGDQLHLHEVAAYFRPKTHVGRWFLEQSLKQPLASNEIHHNPTTSELLSNRRHNIQKLSSNLPLRKEMTDLLEQAQQSERDFSRLFTEEAYDIAAFVRPSRYLNPSPSEEEFYKKLKWSLGKQWQYWVMVISCCYDILTTPKSFKTDISSYRHDLAHAFTIPHKIYCSLALGFKIAILTAIASYEIYTACTMFKNSYEQRRRLARVRNFIETAEQIQALTEKHGLKTQFRLSDAQTPATEKFIRDLKQQTTSNSVFFNVCAVNALYQRFYGNYKDALREYTTVIAEADACCSIANTMEQENKEEAESKQASETQRKPWCITKHTKNTTLHIAANNFYNILVPMAPVRNSVNFERNICLTGPNASGKSVLLRALTHNSLLSQTWGIATGNLFEHTSFDSIIVDFNKSDNLTEGLSLYKAEVIKYLAIAQQLRNAKQRNKRVLIVTDEPLIGTAAQEGSFLAYQIFGAIGEFFPTTAMVLCSTHYAKLTQLPGNTGRSWENYKMDEPRNIYERLVYPYTISPGINMTHIGFSIPEAQKALTLLSSSVEEDELAPEEE